MTACSRQSRTTDAAVSPPPGAPAAAAPPAQPGGDAPAEGEEERRAEHEVGQQALEGGLGGAQQHERPEGPAHQADGAEQAHPLRRRQLPPVGADAGHRAGPEGRRAGGVGLDQGHARPGQGREGQEAAPAGDGVEGPAEEGGGEQDERLRQRQPILPATRIPAAGSGPSPRATAPAAPRCLSVPLEEGARGRRPQKNVRAPPPSPSGTLRMPGARNRAAPGGRRAQ